MNRNKHRSIIPPPPPPQLDRTLAKRCLGLIIAHPDSSARSVHPSSPLTQVPLELCDTPAAPHITALFELRGLCEDQISMHLTPAGKLTVSGDHRMPAGFYLPVSTLPSSSSATTYPVRELHFGHYECSMAVPGELEVEDISARLTNDMLAISWRCDASAPSPVPHDTQQKYPAPRSPP